MKRQATFTFRVNTDERQLIVALATRLARTESDALRWLIREAANELCAEASQVAHPKEFHETTSSSIYRSAPPGSSAQVNVEV
jgi:hypothetical protein